jgi:hypothetical protein
VLKHPKFQFHQLEKNIQLNAVTTGLSNDVHNTASSSALPHTWAYVSCCGADVLMMLMFIAGWWFTVAVSA